MMVVGCSFYTKSPSKFDHFLKSYTYSERGKWGASFYGKNSISIFFRKNDIFWGGGPLKGAPPSETFSHLASSFWTEIFRDERSWWETLLVKISARSAVLNPIYSWFIGDFCLQENCYNSATVRGTELGLVSD